MAITDVMAERCGHNHPPLECPHSRCCYRDLLQAVIAHHGQRADDRCFLDDHLVYAAAGLPVADNRVGDKAAMLENCKRFIDKRCAGGGWASYAELESANAKLKAELTQAFERIAAQSELLSKRAEAHDTGRVKQLETALSELVDVVAADHLVPESVSYMRQAREALANMPPGAVDHGLLSASKALLEAVKEPVEVSMGFDHPPEFANADDAYLAEAIFHLRKAIDAAEKCPSRPCPNCFHDDGNPQCGCRLCNGDAT